MKKIIALALVLVMLFALSACGKEEAPAATEAPAAPEVVETEAPVEETAEPTPEPTPSGIEPDSGMHTFKSDVNGISFEFDSKFVAMQNPVGNVTVFAGTEAEIPFCTISLITGNSAVEYLNELVAATKIEHADAIVTAAAEPSVLTFGEKEVNCIYYTYKDEAAGGVVACAYFAEDLEDGNVVVYSYTALEGETADVEGIVTHAIETFALAK
ncbi:MAG: hypothetical protein IJE09_01815 [Oscillospiraceae bacterium]|nr:hypothetical protein [Oscillospiraceae bacterium]